jgi:hypothetical protein
MYLFPEYIPIKYDILIPINIMKGISMDIIGKVFGKWIVIDEIGRDKKSQRLIKCKCECGTEKVHTLTTLKLQRTIQCKSCAMKDLNKVDDVIGEKYGSWSVLHEVAMKNENRRFMCKCDCGREKEVDGYRLRKQQSAACPNCRIKTHGMSYTDTFSIWQGMISRCTNPAIECWKYYGGRGIKVCDSWLKFENFYKDMGDRPMNLQIDRIDNDGNYEPSNCRWVTAKVNHGNRRCSKRSIQ